MLNRTRKRLKHNEQTLSPSQIRRLMFSSAIVLTRCIITSVALYDSDKNNRIGLHAAAAAAAAATTEPSNQKRLVKIDGLVKIVTGSRLLLVPAHQRQLWPQLP